MLEQPPSVLSPELCREVMSTCGSFNLRKASRAVTRLYDDILQPTGLRSTQVVILVTLAVNDELSLVGLARELVVSPSTLHRNLRPLERDGLIQTREVGSRGKMVALTDKGRDALIQMVPYWEKAQRTFTELVGATAWEDLVKLLSATIKAIGY